jgi:hypothetical protein
LHRRIARRTIPAMRSSACLVLVAAMAACGAPSTATTSAVLSNEAPYAAGPLYPGDYACQIQDGGYDYPPFRCVVRSDGGRTLLEKVEGSVRFRGVIAPITADRFRFDGEVYCPWGDCTEPVHAEFSPQGAAYVAMFQPADRRRDPMRITVQRIIYGGTGYGGYAYGGFGYGYGGFGYGGAGYGGAGYGGYRPHR